MKRSIRSQREKGQGLVEYTMLVLFVAFPALVAFVMLFGTMVQSLSDTITFFGG